MTSRIVTQNEYDIAYRCSNVMYFDDGTMLKSKNRDINNIATSFVVMNEELHETSKMRRSVKTDISSD